MTSPSPYINTTGTTQYIVVHCEPCEIEGTCPTICLVTLDAGEALASGQPFVQVFDDYDEALEVAQSLGYQETIPGSLLPPPELPSPPEPPAPPDPPALSVPDLTPPPIELPPSLAQSPPPFPVGE